MGRDPNEGHDGYVAAVASKLLKSVTKIDQWMMIGTEDSVAILQISVQGPRKTGGDYRAIIKGEDEQRRKWVAFVNGNTLEELHNNIAKQGQVYGFKWREDKPFPPTG